MNKPQAAASPNVVEAAAWDFYFFQLKSMYVDLGCFVLSMGDSLTYVVSLR